MFDPWTTGSSDFVADGAEVAAASAGDFGPKQPRRIFEAPQCTRMKKKKAGMDVQCRNHTMHPSGLCWRHCIPWTESLVAEAEDTHLGSAASGK
jgi:hypothetical protein